MEEIFTARSQASFVYNERNKHWTITCYDEKGKTLWGKNVGCEEGNKLLLDFCCNYIGYIKCKSLVDTICIYDFEDNERVYIHCNKNLDVNVDVWFYTLLIDNLVKMGNGVRIKLQSLSGCMLEYLHIESQNEEKKMDLNMEDGYGHVQNILSAYLLNYIKKESITYARSLAELVDLNHIHINTANMADSYLLREEVYKLERHIKEEKDANFINEVNEEDSMKRAKIKKELE